MAELTFRNVEAVGSNPITSTRRPDQRPKVGSRQGTQDRPDHYILRCSHPSM
jgi:hypothetical protein